MSEKVIFDLVDNLSEEELIDSIEKLDFKHTIQDTIDSKTKERIRERLHRKIDKDIDDPKYKKNVERYKILKNKYRKGLVGSVAAIIMFIILVNISPKIAYALESIPLVNKLVRLVKFSGPYDKGFYNIIEEGRYQQVNKTTKYKGAELTVNTIAGDGLKLWIDYDFKGEGLIKGEMRFTDINDKSILPWDIITNKDSLIKVDRSLNYNEFNIEVDVYKDRPEFHKNISSYTEEELEKLRGEFEKVKVTTLVIPIKLDEDIFGQDSYKEYIVNENIVTEIGDFTVEKIEISSSRTNIYLKLDNESYSNVKFENFRVIDGDGLTYFEADDKIYSKDSSKGNFVISLSGGPKSIENLRVKCDKINYIKDEEKYITVDLGEKKVEDNAYGITLDKIEGNTVVLKRASGQLELTKEDITWNTEEYKLGYDIEGCNFDYFNGVYTFKFKKFKGDILKFEVTSFAENSVEGFEIEIGE